MTALLRLVYEDNELLVVDKPAGLACHPTKGDVYSSLISRTRAFLGPFVEPKLINRLDRETTGLVLLAKNNGVAAEIARIFLTRQVLKTYLAVVHGWLAVDSGSVDAPIGKDTSSSIRIKDCVRNDGAPASTGFEVLRRVKRKQGLFTLVKLTPKTGRKHQIRIHMAHIGHPLAGEKLYANSGEMYLGFVKGTITAADREYLITANHALHAYQVSFPWRGSVRRFVAEPSQEFLKLSEST